MLTLREPHILIANFDFEDSAGTTLLEKARIRDRELGGIGSLGPFWHQRNVLNARDADDIRTGFQTEIFNSRGVFFVDPQGRPDRELAKKYRGRADEVEVHGYHRLATALREVAASYDRQAERQASRADLDD